MVKIMCVSILALTVAILLVTVAKVPAVNGVTCLPAELAPCAVAMTSSSPPSASCCAKLREQKQCLCGYIKNPSLQQFVRSPNAQKVSNGCRIPTPNC
ncbi:hypothetical protein AALP_AA8G280200 [Arabis alpina]|uniref:Bifunctional inhibitor/plant lipid transfer protein/seed storage helical domain-containing protein n=1 Tax=Arabis alpina TaxID=50452 RepID=A0A087G9Y5_ARAAL|nr:hypothetical protein AALP_AA8G280200 [Arabis alpina]